MNKPIVSLIIPVYKIKEKLLIQCLTSLMNQNCKDAEFLIIDDGSPDNCGEICDEYALKDPRMKVFHLENSGVSNARNFGIKKSTGKYIMFLDGDDFLADEFLFKIIKIAENNKKDIIFFKNVKYDENDTKPVQLPSETASVSSTVSPETIAAAIIANNDGTAIGVKNITFGAPWGKIFSADYIKSHNLEFPVGIKKSQDRIFMVRSLSFSPKLLIADIYGYIYVINSTSVCKRYNPDIINICEKAADSFADTIRNYYSDETQKKLEKAYNYLILDFFFVILQLYFFNSNHHSSIKDRKEFVELCKNRKQYFKNCHPSKINKKRDFILRLLKLGLYNVLYCSLKLVYRV